MSVIAVGMIELVALIAAVFGLQETSDDLRGTAGVCIRWDGPQHIADAVVVQSSGNPTLDATLPATIKAMEWQRPDPPYNGGWLGVTFAASGAPAKMPLPKCEQLTKR